MPSSRTTGRLLACLLASYWLALVAATHMPIDPTIPPLAVSDKTLHLAAFGILGLLAGLLLASWEKDSPGRIVLLWIGLMVFAGLDEWTQGFVGRTPDPLDWVADSIGLLLGLVASAIAWRAIGRRAMGDESP